MKLLNFRFSHLRIKNNKNVTVIASVAVLLVMMACSTAKPGVVGIIEFVSGEAFVSSTVASTPEEKSVVLGDTVRFEDQIRTETNSGVELLLKEYGILRIGEKTIFKVSDLSNENRVEVRVNSGKAGMFLKKTTSKKELVITTPTVIAAVRGTQFLVTADASANSKIALFGGAVELQDKTGNKVILDKPGEVKLKKDQSISSEMIEPLSPESIAEMKALETMSSMEVIKAPRQPDQPRQPTIPADPGS